jgi:diguanylate cyclase (GGDEF)-like protein/PAS domain S-box-containing protein
MNQMRNRDRRESGRAESARLILEAINDGFWDWDIPTGTARFSSRYYTMLGYEPYEFPQDYAAWKGLVHPDDIDKVEHQLREYIQRGEGFALELRMRTKSGDWVWILTRGKVVERGADGRPVRMVGSHTEITERKRAEQALKESEVKYRRIFESLEDVYFQTDNKGKIRIVSPSVERAAGWSQEDLIGSSATRVYLNPRDREAVLSALSDKGYIRDYDVTLKKEDGTPILASLSARLLFTDDGYPDGIAGVFRDITDRKMAEEALQYETTFLDAVINCSQEGIYLLDAERQRVFENQRARDLWRMDEDVDDDEARVLHMIRSLKDAGPLRDKLAYLFTHPRDSIQVELELKDGTVLDCHSSPISSAAGKNFGRLWTFRDITQLRHYAKMLEKLSITDALTALANRRRFDGALEREWQRAIHNQSPISLLMIDIDFFKAYNDRYGHPMGDECLRRVASAIAQTVTRPTDLSARYGGEEFACILSDTDMKGAVAVAQRILGAIRSLNLPHLSSTVADHVTVSIGVGTSTPTDGQPYSQLIEAADRSLYRAKQKGRNQIRARGRRRGT